MGLGAWINNAIIRRLGSAEMTGRGFSLRAIVNCRAYRAFAFLRVGAGGTMHCLDGGLNAPAPDTEPKRSPEEEARDILAVAAKNQPEDGPNTRRAAVRACKYLRAMVSQYLTHLSMQGLESFLGGCLSSQDFVTDTFEAGVCLNVGSAHLPFWSCANLLRILLEKAMP